jgi:phytanoyl-CoA hydroxylase
MALAGGHRGALRQRPVSAIAWTETLDDALAGHPPVESSRRGAAARSTARAAAACQCAQPVGPAARHAYALHLIDGRAEYPADNWLQRRDLPLRGFA